MNAAVPLRERVLAAAAATPSLTRPQGRRLAAFLAVLSIAFALALFELAGGLAHARDRPLLASVRLADGWALAAAGLTWLVLRRGSTFLDSPPLLRAATWASPVVLLTWMPRFPGAESTLGSAGACFGLTLAMAAIPLASFLALRRGAEPSWPGTVGAAAGAMAGAWAQVLVLLFCPVTSILHAVLGHVLPLVMLAGIGGIAGGRVLSTSRRHRARCQRLVTSPSR
jgi:hypothetical protein